MGYYQWEADADERVLLGKRMRVVLELSDPWDMGETLGWPKITGTVVAEQDDSWLVEVDAPFEYSGSQYQYIVISARHVDTSLEGAISTAVSCNMIRTTSERAVSAAPCDVSWWRGGRAMIGSVVAEAAQHGDSATALRVTGVRSGVSQETMKRLDQIVLIGTFIGFSWLAMQAVHELGHVLGAVMTGGKVTEVVLHPFTISRTDVHPNPHPLFVAWSGPVIGAVLPLLAFFLARALRSPGVFLFRFLAGFCIIANGEYIGLGSIQGLADAGDMLRHGSSQWQLLLFGILTVPLGLYLWNGLGPKFGLGEAKGTVSRPATITSLALFVILAGTEMLVGSK